MLHLHGVTGIGNVEGRVRIVEGVLTIRLLHPVWELTGGHCANLSDATICTFKCLAWDLPLDFTNLCSTYWKKNGRKICQGPKEWRHDQNKPIIKREEDTSKELLLSSFSWRNPCNCMNIYIQGRGIPLNTEPLFIRVNSHRKKTTFHIVEMK